MVNYGNSLIYKLCCKDVNIDKIYVGSTVNLSRRKSEHKQCCNNTNSKKYNMFVYKFIRDNGGFENWDMIQIMKYPCNDKRELQQKENETMKELKAELNSQSSFNTEEEKKEEKKEEKEEEKEEEKKSNYKDDIINNIKKDLGYYEAVEDLKDYLKQTKFLFQAIKDGKPEKEIKKLGNKVIKIEDKIIAPKVKKYLVDNNISPQNYRKILTKDLRYYKQIMKPESKIKDKKEVEKVFKDLFNVDFNYN
jgi:hypothetical protein